MNVVCHAADLHRFHFILPRDAAEKWPEPLAKLWRDKRATFLCAKHAMMIGTNVRHRGISAVPAGLVTFWFHPPALKRRAIVARPSGTKIRALSKRLLRRVVGKIFNGTEIKGWCEE